ncbi:MAG: glycosyltransferase family 2 protein [Acidobacteriota bacterium]
MIVVNYNGGWRVDNCLEALLAGTYPAQELIVVDNASTDDSPRVIRDIATGHPDVTALWSTSNLGYAAAVNLALTSARGTYVAIMNMDIIVEREWLEPLIDFLENHPQAGAVNPLIMLADGKRVNAGGLDIHVTGLGFTRWLGRSLESIERSPVRVSGVSGALFVVRRDLLARIGGLDATGFLYHEDVNLSWLLQLIGFELYCVRESLVRHDYLLTMYPAKIHLLERNRWAMLFAYLRWSSLLILLPALLLTEILIWGYCILRGSSFIAAKWASYRWVCGRWQEIRERRRLAESVRVISDWSLLKTLRWTYAWNQFVAIGAERGPSARNNVGDIS